MSQMIRTVETEDIAPLAALWRAGWAEAHFAHTPPALHALRTPQSFRERLQRHADKTRTAGPVGAALGLCIVKGDEIDQLYLGPSARGTGLAAQLLSDGEARIRSAGHAKARLFAIPQNSRALRFYEKQGWVNEGETTAQLETLTGTFPLTCCLLTKVL